MKKLFITIFCFVLFLSVGTTTFAQKGTNKPTINFETGKGHKGLSKDEMVKEFEADGMSKADSKYYAELDILIAELERKEINIDLTDESIGTLSNDYIRSNPDEFRQRILSLDKVALKTAFANNEGWSNGSKDLEKAFKNKDFTEITENGKPVGKKVKIKYPDGSVVEGSLKTEFNSNEKLAPNTYLANYKWDQSSLFGSNTNTGEGSHGMITTWQYTSGTNYARVRDIYNYTLNKHNSINSDFWTVHFVSDDGVAASAGAVTADSEINSNNLKTSADRYSYMHGYTDVKFRATGSFSASYAGLSIGASVGATWHQFAVSEVTGGGQQYAWAAQFK